jgi:hypothetical protein
MANAVIKKNGPNTISILLIEDNPGDVYLLKKPCRRAISATS